MAKAITDNGLRRINLIAGVLHLAQMVAVLALASDFTLPITARYMSGPPGSTYGDLIVLWDAPLAIGVAVFLGLSALAHFIVVSPKFFPRYIAGLAAHRNFFRWVEYSISSSQSIENKNKVNEFFNRSDVIAKFESMGVTPQMAQERINAMTQAEVNQLAQNIDSLPAGGTTIQTAGWIGIVLGLGLLLYWLYNR